MIFGRRYRLRMSLPGYLMRLGDEIAYSGSTVGPNRGRFCAMMQHVETGRTRRTDRDTKFLFFIGREFSSDRPPERSPDLDTALRLDQALAQWMTPIEEGG